LRLNKATMKKTTHKTGVRNKADQNIFESVGLMGFTSLGSRVS